VLSYSLYGHAEALAASAIGGVLATPDVEAHLMRFPEVLTPEELHAMHAIVYEDDDPRYVPPVNDPASLAAFDAFVFVFPVRFGCCPAAVQALFDATGKLWETGALVGKPAAVIVTGSSQHGGLEMALEAFHHILFHHGVVIVGPESRWAATSSAKPGDIDGFCPYGLVSSTGDAGERMPSAWEHELASRLAKRVCAIAQKLM
jgi:NAD(P)H dehydrogenase (quinone)